MTAVPTDGSTEEPSSLFRVVMEMDIGENSREAFFTAWQAMAAAAANDPAVVSQTLSVDTKQPSRYFIVSEWTDEERYRRFAHGAAHDENVGAMRAVSRAVTILQMHQVLTSPGVHQQNGAPV